MLIEDPRDRRRHLDIRALVTLAPLLRRRTDALQETAISAAIAPTTLWLCRYSFSMSCPDALTCGDGFCLT
jgi:hypothetical protein